MRKMISSLLWAVVSGVMLLSGVSCEKMVVSSTADDNDDANVILRVASFEQVPFSLARTRREASEICRRLNFIIYRNGQRIRQDVQVAEDEGFGTTEFRLAEGRYYVVVLAHSCAGNPITTRADSIVFTNSTGYTDTFYWADSVFVEPKNLVNDKIEKTLNLERFVSKIRFEFHDAIPAKAERVRFMYKGGTGKFNAFTGYGKRNSDQIQWYDISRKEKAFEIYTIPHSEAQEYINVNVNCFDQTESEVTDKSISDIPILRNHVTICRGFLFSPVYGTGFNITISDIWDADTLIYDF